MSLTGYALSIVSLPADTAAVTSKRFLLSAASKAARNSRIRSPKLALSDGSPGLSARPPKIFIVLIQNPNVYKIY